MLRNRLLSTVFFIALTAPAAAETVEVSLDVAYESRYVFRGIQFAESSIQPAITVSYGGLYGGAWFSLPIGDDDGAPFEPYGDELDLYVGYSAALTESVTYDVGVTYYTFPDAQSGFFDIFEEDGDGLGANTVEIYGGLSLDIPLSPSLYVYHDFMFDTTTFEGGASYSIPLMEKTSFDLGGTIGYVIDDDAGGDYVYGVASADVSYALSDAGSVYVGVRYGGSDLAGGSLIDDSIAGTTEASGVWWGVGFSSSF